MKRIGPVSAVIKPVVAPAVLITAAWVRDVRERRSFQCMPGPTGGRPAACPELREPGQREASLPNAVGDRDPEEGRIIRSFMRCNALRRGRAGYPATVRLSEP